MVLHKDNIYSFDENSVLHTCIIQIPKSHIWIFNKTELKHKNCDFLNQVLVEMHKQNIIPHRFSPSNNLEQHLLETANDLIEATKIQLTFLNNIFRKEIIDQLKDFTENLKEWKEINKTEEFKHIKDFFKKNEKQLKKSKIKKYTNIPEDDDCQILAGLINFPIKCLKFLISHDEHFWGYTDIILENYGIQIIEEWNCQKLL